MSLSFAANYLHSTSNIGQRRDLTSLRPKRLRQTRGTQPLPLCTTSPPNRQIAAHPLLTDADAQRQFLRTAWGVRPVLIRNLLPAYECPVTPDDLAALSEDPSLHSRLITGATALHAGKSVTTTPYTLRLGPFPPSTWNHLTPGHPWTLLVQGLDRRVPQLADLLDLFAFLPSWRVDDIQASYAPVGGGVGPHVDNYDVFLVQGAGRRHWRVSHTAIPSSREHCIQDIDVRVLRDAFPVDGDFILEPGDALYVPPRFPHWGVSLDDECVTLSVGFRAPSASALLAGWVEHLVDTHALGDVFFTDGVDDLCDAVGDAGRIPSSAADRAFDLLSRSFKEDEATRREFATWFAQEVSRRKTFVEDDEEDGGGGEADFDCLRAAIQRHYDDTEAGVVADGHVFGIRQQPGAVFTYVANKDSRACVMYIDGEAWAVDHIEIAQTLCSKRYLNLHVYVQLAGRHESFMPLVESLFSAGLLYTDDGTADEVDDVDDVDDVDEEFENDLDEIYA